MGATAACRCGTSPLPLPGSRRRSLQDTCALVHQRWAHEQQQGGSRLQRDDPLLTAFVRLLIQFFTTQLRYLRLALATRTCA